MEHLLQELLQRWEQAFGEMETPRHYKAQVKATRYADGFRYSLDKFDRTSFPSGGPMSMEKEDTNESELYEYGFNADGLPCYVAFGHNHNNIHWEGLYTYNDNLVEYVEFCRETGVPSTIERIQYQEGRKTSLQTLLVNGRGSSYAHSQLPGNEIIDKVKKDGHSLIITVTQYEYGSEDRINKASSIHISPSLGKFTSHDEYTYDSNGNLDTIRRFYEQGSSQLMYCRLPEDANAETLVATLAQSMAQAILEALAKSRVEQPVARLELYYHYADTYLPLLVCQSARELAENMDSGESDFTPGFSNDIDISFDTTPIEKQYAQLEQMMDADDSNMDLGRTMLRKAASVLTKNKLFGRLAVTDDFTAYAIDWSIEGQDNNDLAQILLECGVEAACIENWRKKGTFPE